MKLGQIRESTIGQGLILVDLFSNGNKTDIMTFLEIEFLLVVPGLNLQININSQMLVN